MAEEQSNVFDRIRDAIRTAGAAGTAGAAAWSTKLPAEEIKRYLRDKDVYSKGVGSIRDYTAKPGDISIFGYADEFNQGPWSLFGGNPAQTHAEALVPNEINVLRSTVPRVLDRSESFVGNPKITSLLKTIQRNGADALLRPVKAWGDSQKLLKLLTSKSEQQLKNVAPGLFEASTYGGLYGTAGDDGVVQVVRPKQALSPEELAKMRERIPRSLGMAADIPDMLAQGIRRLFGVSENGRPSVCVGGVCDVYSGIRDLPHQSRALGPDLAHLKDFETVYASKMSPERLKVMRNVAGMRTAGKAAIPLTLATLAYNMLPGSQDKSGSAASALGERVFSSLKSVPGKAKVTRALTDNKDSYVPAFTTAVGLGGLGGYLLGNDSPVEDINQGAVAGLTVAGSSLALDRLRSKLTGSDAGWEGMRKLLGSQQKHLRGYSGLAAVLLGALLPTAGAAALAD